MAFRRRKKELVSEKTTKLKEQTKPKKPWGKKERVFVFSIVGSTSVIALFLAIFSRHGKLPGLPRISGETIGFSDTVILTKTTTPPSFKERENATIMRFAEQVSKLSGIYAFSAVDLTTGNSYGFNDIERMQAASLMKLPVMALLLQTAEQGKINLDSVYTLKDEDKIGGSGSIINKPAGETYTYRELLSYMGKQSDNTAFNVVRKKLGEAAINKFINEIGMKNTDFAENITTPSDVALLLRKVYEGRMFETDLKEEFLEALTETIYEDYLPTGIPDDIRVAHKYGREIHVINDAGIVYSTDPYVVVIMTDGVVESEAEVVFTTLSQIIFEGQSS